MSRTRTAKTLADRLPAMEARLSARVDKEVAEDLKALLSKRPELAGEFLRVIADAMAEYERSQARKRGSLADNAIRAIMQPKWFRKADTPWSVDAIYHQFPNGIGNHAKVEVECFEAFLERLRETGEYRDPDWLKWLRESRGDECFAWFQAQILPHIAGEAI